MNKKHIKGSLEQGWIAGDKYEVGMSLANVMAVIISTFGEQDGQELIHEANHLARQILELGVVMEDTQLAEISKSIQKEQE